MEETGAAERTTLPARKRGASSNLSISLVGHPPPAALCLRRFFLVFLFFFIANAEAWQARDRSQDALRRNAAAKRGIPTEIYIRNGAQ